MQPTTQINCMKWYFLLGIVASCLAASCRHSPADGHPADHAHDARGHHVDPDDVPLDPLSFTIYSAKTELFVEFKPMIKGMQSRLAVHLTALGDIFTAIDTGRLTLSIIEGGQIRQSVTAENPDAPGLFRLSITPAQAGDVDLVFLLRTPDGSDSINIHHVQVFEDEPAALAAYATATPSAAAGLTYSKEQAWKVEFANTSAVIEPFADVIRTTGRIEVAPGDMTTLTAQVGGILSYLRPGLLPGTPVALHQPLFSLRPGEVVQSNLGTAILQAEQEVETARKQYERARDLASDKIVSEKDLLEAKRRYDAATARLADLEVTKDFQRRQQTIHSPMTGFLLALDAGNGAYVMAGQPVATVTANKRMLVRADLSQRHFPLLQRIQSANIERPDGHVFRSQDLHGRVVASGHVTAEGSPFVPFYVEIDRAEGLIPGAVVQLYLQTDPKPALVIPAGSILEEQGNYYVYVQTGGESFQKRDIRIGATDGLRVVVLTGLKPGERVVSKGAYQIRLATAAGAIPAHGHEH